MPSERNSTYALDKDAAICTYLRIPRTVARAHRVTPGDGDNERYTFYFYDNQMYLVYRKAERPQLNGHTFRYLFTYPKAPWSVHRVDRRPPGMYDVSRLQGSNALERVEGGASFDDLTPEDQGRAFAQCMAEMLRYRRAANRMAQAPQDDIREAARVAAKLAQCEKERDDLRAAMNLEHGDWAPERDRRIQELEAQVQQLKQDQEKLREHHQDNLNAVAARYERRYKEDKIQEQARFSRERAVPVPTVIAEGDPELRARLEEAYAFGRDIKEKCQDLAERLRVTNNKLERTQEECLGLRRQLEGGTPALAEVDDSEWD